MTYSEISKKLMALGYKKPKREYIYDDRKYTSFSRGTYSVTVFMTNEFKVLNLSFQHVSGVDYTYLIATDLTGSRVMTGEEFMDIISRIDMRKMSKYPADRMKVVLRNIMNERALDALEG